MNCLLKRLFPSFFFLCIIFSTIFSLCSCKAISSSLLVSNVGNWGLVEQCSKYTYVKGFQLKVEPVQNFEDDNTALNGIRFLCGNIGGKVLANFESNEILIRENSSELNKTGENTIESFSGPWGTWGKVHYCSENQYAIGFQLNTQSIFTSSKKDMSGATNFRLVCSTSGNTYEVVEGDGMDWGTWTDTQFCEKHQIICSIQTKVQVSIKDPSLKNCYYRESNGSVDQQSLTDVKMGCCHLPNPGDSCIPSESWQLIKECDNSELNIFEVCNYGSSVGISYDVSSTDYDPGILKVYNDVDIDMKEVAAALAKNFNDKFKWANENFDKATNFSWDDSFDKEIWELEKESRVSLHLPPGYAVKVYQVVGKCGFYLVKTGRFRRIYTTISENGHPVSFEEYFYNSTTFDIENELLKYRNESHYFDLDDEMEIVHSAEFLTYLILGLIAGSIGIGFVTYFLLKLCIKKYTDKELVSDSFSRTSTSPNPGSSSIEMERF